MMMKETKVMIVLFIILEIGAMYIIAPTYSETKEGFAYLLVFATILNAYVSYGMTIFVRGES